MCCWSHAERDAMAFFDPETRRDLINLLARDPRLRCQCKFGDDCKRQATEEDMLCDYCRDCGHSINCDEAHETHAQPDPQYGFTEFQGFAF